MSRTICKTITCTAPIIVFTTENYDGIPEIERARIDAMHGLACDGGGMEGEWCLKHNCVYAESDYHYSY